MPDRSSEISDVKTSEFFIENMSMLGFSNPSRALVMSVKEAVDNSLDSCEDIGVTPEIEVELIEKDSDVVTLHVSDNAAGIPRDQIIEVFGEILFSSRFGVWSQSRGQQGIGISAVHLWGQKHVGNPTRVISLRQDRDQATRVVFSHRKKGEESIVHEREDIDWDRDHGTELWIDILASWNSRQKVEKYLEATSIANPSAEITYIERGQEQTWERELDRPQDPPQEMNPHPHAADLGMVQKMISQTHSRTVKSWLLNEWCEIGEKSCHRILKEANIEPDNPFLLDEDAVSRLTTALRESRVRNPGDEALSPLGDEVISRSLSRYQPEFMGTHQRQVITVGGHPTLIETGVAYGGQQLARGGPSEIHRVANRVPLVYDRNSCAMSRAIREVDWTNYEMDQTSSGEPIGPAVIFIHVCSTSVQFGNEAKTYIAQSDQIVDELRKSLQQCGRDFSKFLRETRRRQNQNKKVDQMVPLYQEITEKVDDITDSRPQKTCHVIARSCNTVIDTGTEIMNPTDKNRTIEIDGEDHTLSPGESVEYHEDYEYRWTVVESESING